MIPVRRLCLILAVLTSSSLYAEQASAPDVEFLEFLGEWQTKDGQWQDPIELMEMQEANLLQVKESETDEQFAEEEDHEE